MIFFFTLFSHTRSQRSATQRLCPCRVIYQEKRDKRYRTTFFFIANVPARGPLGPQRTNPFFLLYFSMFVICFVFSSCYLSLCSQVYLEFQSPDQNHQIVQTRP